jgi:hypothetical protein
MPTDPADPDFARAPAVLEELFSAWLSGGACPCRFPRFRATVERETDALGASMMTWEQYTLMQVYDRRVKLVHVKAFPGGREGACSLCGAHVHRWGVEVVRDQWLEHMRVVPRPDAAELGAPQDGPLPHCWPFFTVGGDDARARRDAQVQYPRLGFDAWVAWMRARREDTAAGSAG